MLSSKRPEGKIDNIDNDSEDGGHQISHVITILVSYTAVTCTQIEGRRKASDAVSWLYRRRSEGIATSVHMSSFYSILST